ncbi:Voltage-dependent calcium channel subunit alpha-2/delta-1 [Liparis tanakae]|uniref:Voltage-dependent calcium channel subunit alpha-2/delta-1 n=1 Tax=Liparis tanakae TaxID=230148 RepID=A0A4Z2J8V3_9TELE|nr:Voltage-dependent calcium channel subunit alpha-2/delta-1 [Liparis tanakae]
MEGERASRETQEGKIGQFFGEVDPVLMINLVNTSLYAFNKTYDYQSVCDPEKDSKAAAGPRSVYVPTIADVLSIGWWASSAAWSILQQLLVGLVFPNLLEAVESADDDIPDAMFKESCITEQTQYFFDNNESSYSENTGKTHNAVTLGSNKTKWDFYLPCTPMDEERCSVSAASEMFREDAEASSVSRPHLMLSSLQIEVALRRWVGMSCP